MGEESVPMGRQGRVEGQFKNGKVSGEAVWYMPRLGSDWRGSSRGGMLMVRGR